MHDLLIRGGTVVDGTGAAPVTADITVDDGRISGVGAHARDAARRTVDADGLLVTRDGSTSTPTMTVRPRGTRYWPRAAGTA